MRTTTMTFPLEKKVEIATGLLEQTIEQLKKSDKPSEAYIFLKELLSNFIALNSNNHPNQPKVEEIKKEIKEEDIPPLSPIRKKESLISKFKNLFKGKNHDSNLTECDQKEQQDSKESRS